MYMCVVLSLLCSNVAEEPVQTARFVLPPGVEIAC